jgi:TetR/AcrR family transcriptional repressor of nem operon
MSSKVGETPRKTRTRGRPRGFDVQDALEAAMRVFWSRGYEGASIDQLCKAMGVPKASLYQHFGTKEQLFRATLDHYGASRLGPVVDALGPRGDLHEDLDRFFVEVVRLATGAYGPTGCMVSCVLSDAAGSNPSFQEELERRFAALEERLTIRIAAAAMEEGRSVPAEVEAMLLASIARGIMLRGRAGATPDMLTLVARAATAHYAHTSPPS